MARMRKLAAGSENASEVDVLIDLRETHRRRPSAPARVRPRGASLIRTVTPLRRPADFDWIATWVIDTQRLQMGGFSAVGAWIAGSGLPSISIGSALTGGIGMEPGKGGLDLAPSGEGE